MNRASTAQPRERCNAKTRSGAPCANPAGFRTGTLGVGRCYLHGGMTPGARRGAQLAQRECAKLAVPMECDPAGALLGELFRTCGWVAAYETAVQELALEEGEHWRDTYGPSGKPTGEAKPHVLVELLHRERRHLTDVTSAALRANIDERRVRIVEDQAAMVHRAFEAALEALSLTAGQRQEARSAYGRHLRLAD